MSTSVILYRFGPIAWFWRTLIGAAVAGSLTLIVLAVHTGSFALALIALPVLAPAAFFAAVVVVRLEVDEDAVDSRGRLKGNGQMLELRATQLGFWRRSIPPERLGEARIRETAYSDTGRFYAPRAWVRVRGALPLYFDLLGDIARPRAFGQALGLPPNAPCLRGESLPTGPPPRSER